MAINLNQYKNRLLFVPLGGSNEIGLNVNLYHYNGKWIMVDCGSGFADEHLPGVDMIVADLSFIEERKKDLIAIILTHAHEDHLGGIQYLWNDLGCPIYTTKFTKTFLESKLVEYNFPSNFKINTIIPSKRIKLDPFLIDTIPLTHSAPEMQALLIRTDAGNILHTGDWKFDPDPIVGTKTDQEALQKFGDNGILALVCDSTNVFNEGISGSEGEVRRSLFDIIKKCKSMVVVTTFASNLARLDTLIHAGQASGRKVVLSGRSLHRMFDVAVSCGYLKNINPIIDEKNIGDYKREEILIIATGCQGEKMASTSKIASGTHSRIKLLKQDTVIFSSKIIPGNEKKIFRLFNAFVKNDIEVITEQDHFVHVSGHPGVEELKRMYELIRPQVCIPVHGEPVHIHQHARLAKSSGIPEVIKVSNGDVVMLDKTEGSKIIDTVKHGYLAVDGNYLLSSESKIFSTRIRLKNSGVVVLSMVFRESTFNLVCPPILSLPGMFEEKEDIKIINQLKNILVIAVNEYTTKTQVDFKVEKIKAYSRRIIKRFLKQEVNKNPYIIINIEEVK